MLARLEIGLADEGHRVLHAVPASLADAGLAPDAPAVYSTPVPYADSGLPLTGGLRAQSLLETIAATAPPDAGRPAIDAVHAYGRSAWSMGERLARRTGSALLLEVFDGASISPAAEAALLNKSVHLVAADGPIAEQLAKRVDPSRVHSCPWGVHLAEVAHDDEQIARGAGVLTIAILTTGNDADSLRTAVKGAAALAGRPEFVQRGVMLFVDAEVARQRPVWRWADEAGLGGRLSVIADLEGRREMVLQADVLMSPDCEGRQRSFLLDAMAAGMLIVARPDPLTSALIDGQTCRLVAGNTPESWAEAVGSLLGADHAATARQLGEAARAYVRGERLASRHVASVLAAYSKLPAATLAGAPR